MSVRRGELARLEVAGATVVVENPRRRFVERLARSGPRGLRHLPEAAVEGLLVYGSQRAAQQTGAPWTGSLVSALAVGALCWCPALCWGTALCLGPARRRLFALAGRLFTRARPRPAAAEGQRLRRTGRSPRTTATLPAGSEERAWLLCPVRVSVDDLADENGLLRATCVAHEVRVTPGRFATVVVPGVVRRSRPVSAAAGSPRRGAAPPGTRAGRGAVGSARCRGVGTMAGRWRL
jgi:hypothetical protein